MGFPAVVIQTSEKQGKVTPWRRIAPHHEVAVHDTQHAETQSLGNTQELFILFVCVGCAYLLRKCAHHVCVAVYDVCCTMYHHMTFNCG
jgi:hypothetical protein